MKVLALALLVGAFATVHSANDEAKKETTLLRGIVKALKELNDKENATPNEVFAKSVDVSWGSIDANINEKDAESMIDIENGKEKQNTNVKPKEAADGETEDIVEPDPKESDDLLKRQAYADTYYGGRLWKNGVVPYYFGPRAKGWTSAIKAQIRKGFKWWHDTTCIRFKEYESEQDAINKGVTRYLDVGTGGGCSSGVGAQKPTKMILGGNCLGEGVVSHEAGHTLGFGHIQSRDDRDQYVKINLNNVKEENQFNYNKIDSLNVVPYDLQSTMHYGPTFFSKGNGAITIEALDKRLQFLVGSRSGLSHYDVKMMNSIYNCTVNCRANDCQNTGYPGPSPACKCQCPDLLTGNRCQSVSSTGVSRYDPKCNDMGDIKECLDYKNDGGCAKNHYNNNYIKWKCRKTCRECSDDPPSQSCVGIIHLGNGQSRTLSTPKNTNGKCLWIVKVNEGYTVRLKVNEFEVARNTDSGECYHWLEVRYNLLSQKGPKFCGSGWTNGQIQASPGGDVRYMVLRYDSIKASSNPLRGFAGTVTSVKLKVCGSPAVKDGIVTGKHHEGQTVTIACKAGYIHKSGDLERFCKDGKWSGVAPVCIVNKCDNKINVADLQSCTYLIGKGYCTDSGYGRYMADNCARACCETALLKGSLVDCGQPPSVAGGSIQGTDFSERGKITITCTGGRSLVSGDRERTCQGDGTWSGTTPVCKSINCGSLSVSNGIVVGLDFSFGKKVTISCIKGYLLTAGDKERTCQSDGTWSGKAASCKKNTCLNKNDRTRKSSCDQWIALKYCTEGKFISYVNEQCSKSCCEEAIKLGKVLADCGQPPSVAGGVIQGSDTAEGAKITITCTGANKLVSGSAQRTCQKDGKWSGTTPVCSSVNCGGFFISNGFVTRPGSTVGDKATISCNQGYLMTSGDKERTCQADGSWSGTAAVCKKNACLNKEDNAHKSSCDQWVALKYCTEKFVDYVNRECSKSCCEEGLLK